MCYSAMVEQNADSLADLFNATIRWDLISDSIHLRKNHPGFFKYPKAFDHYLKNQDHSKENRQLITEIGFHLRDSILAQSEDLKAEIYDLEYELAKKERIGLRKKLNSKIKKLNKNTNALQVNKNLNSSEELFIYPHWGSFAVYKNGSDTEVCDFQYGHFRNTGLLLDDILYHLGKHPRSPQYSLYNTKIESLNKSYFHSTRENLSRSYKRRKESGLLQSKDFQNSKGIFDGKKKEAVQNFLDIYSIDPESLSDVRPSQTSYLEKLFPKNKAIVVAHAFGESVLKSDYYKDQTFSQTENKHIPVEFYQESELCFFPAIYSEVDLGSHQQRGLSIITSTPRPEVFDRGHDRSPICLNVEGAKAYLEENLNPEEIFELFNYYSDPTPFLSREKLAL